MAVRAVDHRSVALRNKARREFGRIASDRARRTELAERQARCMIDLDSVDHLARKCGHDGSAGRRRVRRSCGGDPAYYKTDGRSPYLASPLSLRQLTCLTAHPCGAAMTGHSCIRIGRTRNTTSHECTWNEIQRVRISLLRTRKGGGEKHRVLASSLGRVVTQIWKF